jgi:hypothetical protein
MTDGNYRIVTTLDRPIRIVVFTPGEFLLILVPIILGVILGGFIGLCVAISRLILRKRVGRLQRQYSKREMSLLQRILRGTVRIFMCQTLYLGREVCMYV